ncbi:Z1 domain-containing protein [Bradyrhizobium sp. SZCCHNR3054]|uniref:Z1 domain-containing protein n=1 Tax=Bradyrhizobium sp. SZCCHNR3054 TaxID=3057419 RepID=UPI00291672A2|nr:Z1 domain-containing protein [Bradyrhizobium sp. SZCCHNR3054]
MLENLKNLEVAVEGFLAREAAPTPEKIRELIKNFRIIPTCNVSDDDAERLARHLETRHDVTMTIGAMLTSRDFEPWLEARRSGIEPYYWSRYRRLLAEKNYSSQVLATMDNVTDRILGLLENPDKEGPWDRRGMVVGHVQSGKTANYIGLICKAADAGYRIIVVIAGIHNNLRNQTQARIDEGFVGRDSASKVTDRNRRIVGVGRYDSRHLPWTFTNSVRDFNRVGAEQVGGKLSDLRVPAVFVIKKNSNTLKNLTDWLKDYNARGGGRTVEAPMLLIDDEADNASINIKHDKGEVSRINGQIRELLRMFERSCYVGYTATPFANIFISPDTDDEMLGEDLFPRNFIVGLDPPTNYFGAERVFIDEPTSFIRHIEDNEDYLPLKHEKDLQVTSLPPSLMRAVRTFVVARAIRLVRGQVNQHSSMLVNASRFTDVQRQIRNEIHVKLEAIQASCRVNGALSQAQALRDPEIRELHAVWEEEYSDTNTEWPQVQKVLHDAASPIRAVEVNSRSSGTLNYTDHEKTGLNVIAVGGFSLSRGLTLEGLMVSYFLRNSMMYDTLMQMGRWFGYRPDYEDLCRVWMLDEAESWYRYIAVSIEELREEMRKMEEANATPEEFGLKVRSHPDTLIVTARNKMGSGEQVVVQVGLGNEFIETTALRWDDASLETNRRAAISLAERLAAAGKSLAGSDPVPGGRLLRNVPVGPILEFLTEFQNDPQSMLTDPVPVRRYIDDRARGELRSWDILVPSVSRLDHVPLIDRSLGIEVTCQRRKAGERSRPGRTLLVTDNQRVASRGVEKTGVDPDAIKTAEAEYRKKKNLSETDLRNYPDKIYRDKRQRPLLILHLLAIGEADTDLSAEKPVVAWSISFPTTSLPEDRVEYIVNTTWMRENYRNDIDEDEMAGDDE